MRFLCLHGMGTSGTIFKAQTAAFRRALPKDEHTFDFIDAPHEVPPTASVSPFFPPPHFTFTRSYTDPTELASAPEFVLGKLREAAAKDEPYDALLCFSQGASVAAALLMQLQQRGEPLPFKAAVFICGGPPLPVLEDLGVPVPQKAWDIAQESGRELARKGAMAKERIAAFSAARKGGDGAAAAAAGDAKGKEEDKEGETKGNSNNNNDATGASTNKKPAGLWHDTSTLLHTPDVPLDDPTRLPASAVDEVTGSGSSDVYGLDLSRLPTHATLDAIPTVHVYGRKDPRYVAGVQMALFATRPERRRTFDHGGGHEIPRTPAVSNMLAEMVGWMARVVREDDERRRNEEEMR